LAVSLALAFFGLAILFSYSDNALVQRVYALTYPWGYQYRLLMLDAILASLIGGVGLIRVSRWLGKAHGAAQRGWRRTAFRAVLVTSGFAAAASVIGMTLLIASVRSAYDTVTA